MEKFFSVAAVIAPIFITVYLGMVARKKALITERTESGMRLTGNRYLLSLRLHNQGSC